MPLTVSKAAFNCCLVVVGESARECKGAEIGTVVVQLSVPNKTAIRKCFCERYLRIADLH